MVSAVAGAVMVIESPETTGNCVEMLMVPVTPDAANTTVPNVELPSTSENVVEAVVAVIRVHLLVAVTPLYVPVPATGMFPETGVLKRFTTAETPYTALDRSANTMACACAGAPYPEFQFVPSNTAEVAVQEFTARLIAGGFVRFGGQTNAYPPVEFSHILSEIICPITPPVIELEVTGAVSVRAK